jgi:hypothetical protein
VEVARPTPVRASPLPCSFASLNASAVASGATSATPPGSRCAATVANAARSSFSLLMYITASWMKTASKARPSLTVRMSPGTCSHSGLSTADLAHPVCRLDEGQRERPLHVRGVAAVAV